MLKLGCGAVALLSLLASAFLLWAMAGAAEVVFSGPGGWVAAWLEAFRNPGTAVVLLGVCALFAFAAASVTELLLSLLFSILAALTGLLCLLGALAVKYPEVGDWAERVLG